MIDFCQRSKNLSLTKVFVLFLGVVSFFSCNFFKENKVYKIAYMICNSEKETIERFEPLNAYLEKETGYKFSLKAIDTVDFEDAHKKEKFDFTHSNPVIYIILNKEYGFKHLVAEKNGLYGVKTLGTIIVKKDSSIQSIKDLKGKKMIFGPTFAPFGYVTQLELLLRNGIDPYKDVSIIYQPKHSFQHEKIVYGVWFGSYDAGAAPMLDLEDMSKEGKIKLEEDFRIIAKTDLHPYCNFAYNPSIPDEVVKKVEKALLKIDKNTTVEFKGEKLNLFKAAKIEGYERLNDSDFDGLRNILKKINFPPYQTY